MKFQYLLKTRDLGPNDRVELLLRNGIRIPITLPDNFIPGTPLSCEIEIIGDRLLAKAKPREPEEVEDVDFNDV